MSLGAPNANGPGITWAPEMFAAVGDDFGLGGLQWQSAAPRDYPSNSGDNRVQEECVETLLALHFAALFGARPRCVLRSRAMHSVPSVNYIYPSATITLPHGLPPGPRAGSVACPRCPPGVPARAEGLGPPTAVSARGGA